MPCPPRFSGTPSTFWSRVAVLVNHRQQSAGFERPKEARVDFGRLGEVMIHEPHEDGITTLRRKIRLSLAGLEGSDVFLLRRKLFQMGQLFGIEFRGVDPPCRAHALGGGECHLSPASADFGHDAALLPVQHQGQTVGFLLVVSWAQPGAIMNADRTSAMISERRRM